MSGAAQTKAGARRKVVFIVEDDAGIRDMLVKALAPKYEVHQAGDGLAASEKIGTMPPPDLLICDVMMPRVDGFTFTRMIKADAAFKSVPVIFLTAKSSPQDVVTGIKLGAKHYMAKPFSVPDLLDKVAKLLD